ncbi:hypothetical protein DM01DRAFT_1334295 [Hesseltinella vesiculosa]|uniref:Uncharacterized protein n=1 Tax=Hesseltinella vesiculosa TaxID=101127 RepID=A0A1X2GMU7_9FUNG|nr:hypothetical protein DM01DRAFT_1334295 [Hesseltinella vesiculosa]
MEANRNKPTKKQSQQDQEPQLFIITETNKLDQRRLALQACGFGVSKPQMDQLLSELQEQGDDDKAAAWALFNGLHDRAIEILSEAKDPDKSFQRKLISMVLDKSQDASHNDTWQQLCDQLIAQVCDQPYLRAIFKYISANDWTPVLDDESLRLQERLVIALRFLDDDKLTAYLSRTLSSSILSGNLEGLMLTGLYTQGMDLLESHVNQTSDVQTAALIISLVVPRKLQDPRADEWIECYRTLLDRWQLWHHRAKFDIQRGKLMHAPEDIAPPQVYVRCTFCAQTLGHSIVAPNVKSRDGKRVNVQASMSPSSANRITSKQKSNICSSCRKALPRCALCLLHLGTPTDPIRKAITTNNVNCEDPSGFNLWFTWCQTCRHGGHAMHISEWFRKHSACPVSNCTCQCQSFFE